MEPDDQTRADPPAEASPASPVQESADMAEAPDPSEGPGAPAAPAGNGPAGDEGGKGLEGHHLLELWSDREEIHALPDILRPAEGLVAVGSGTVVRSGRLAQSKWLVVLTDRRLLCIKGRAAVTRKVIDMPVSQIRGVETKGIFRKTLSLDTGYGTLRISGVKKNVAVKMVDGITTLMGAYSEDGGEKATAIPKADLSKAGPRGGRQGEIGALEETVGTLGTKVEELTERVAFLEELVRSNVGNPQ